MIEFRAGIDLMTIQEFLQAILDSGNEFEVEEIIKSISDYYSDSDSINRRPSAFRKYFAFFWG